jgi:hypothetical protein
MHIRILFKLCMILVVVTLTITSSTAFSADKKAKRQKQSDAVNALHDDPAPFGFVLGKTTSDEAKEIWDEEDAEITGTGFGQANPSTEDDEPDGVLNKDVIMYDVKGLPMDQLDSARFGFVNDKLYLIKYELNGDKERIALQLIAKYGEPNGSSGEFFSDDIHTWRFKNITLQLRQDFDNNHLLFIHNKLADNVSESNAKIYSKFIFNKAKTERGF